MKWVGLDAKQFSTISKKKMQKPKIMVIDSEKERRGVLHTFFRKKDTALRLLTMVI